MAQSEFPYEMYKRAVEGESLARAAGVEANVTNVESDENRPGCYLLGVDFKGACDEAGLEEGCVCREGVPVAKIVSVDADAGIIAVQAEKSSVPSVGDHLELVPPDYLLKLREFAKNLLSNPEVRNEARFLELRAELLRAREVHGPELPATPYLRPAQREALEEAEARSFSFVWGPPGTGKSYTLGHIAAHFRAQGKKILLLSNTNAAVDVTTFAIDDACGRTNAPLKEGDLIRYSRVLEMKDEYERRPHLLAFTKLLNEIQRRQRELEKKQRDIRRRMGDVEKESPDHTELMFKLSSVTEQMRNLGEERRRQIAELLGRAQIVCCSITSCLYNNFAAGNFDVVLVDEASLVPVAVWPYLLNVGARKKFVVAGDPMQLAPVGARSIEPDAKAWFDMSLYGALGMVDFGGIRPFYEIGAVTLLNEQTRMRRGIRDFVSRLFYNGLLIGERADERMAWPGVGEMAQEIAVLDPSCMKLPSECDRLPDRGGPHTNATSAGHVLRLVKDLVAANPPGRKVRILVVTPFRNQALKVYWPRLKKMASDGRDVSVEVATVHRCQGKEADVVIFDMVDPTAWFLNGNGAAHLWCVACSRARHNLVLVGRVAQMAYGRFTRQVLLSLVQSMKLLKAA